MYYFEAAVQRQRTVARVWSNNVSPTSQPSFHTVLVDGLGFAPQPKHLEDLFLKARCHTSIILYSSLQYRNRTRTAIYYSCMMYV